MMTMNMDGWTQDISYLDTSLPARMGMGNVVADWWNQLTGIQKFLIISLVVGIPAMLIYYRDEDSGDDTMNGRKRKNPKPLKHRRVKEIHPGGYGEYNRWLYKTGPDNERQFLHEDFQILRMTEKEFRSKILPLIASADEAEIRPSRSPNAASPSTQFYMWSSTPTKDTEYSIWFDRNAPLLNEIRDEISKRRKKVFFRKEVVF